MVSRIEDSMGAGARRHVVVRFSSPMANADTAQAIPVVSRDWLRGALESARAKAEGKKRRRRRSVKRPETRMRQSLRWGPQSRPERRPASLTEQEPDKWAENDADSRVAATKDGPPGTTP